MQSRWLALLAAAGVLTLIAPVLAVVSFYLVAYSMDFFLVREDLDVCETYACGAGAGWVLIFFSLGWMCVIWIVGLAVAALAIRTRVSIGRAVVAALATALVVTIIAALVDFAWVVWSV